MRYAIISDIHANLEALLAVLDEIDKCGADCVICLGDIVGYGASPNECVEVIKERQILSLTGNHDKAACGLTEPIDFNPLARRAVLWTREALTPGNREFLRSLPEEGTAGDFMIVHGAPSDPDRYILSEYDAEEEFPLLGDHRLCFFGHTHVRILYSLSGEGVGVSRDERVRLLGGASCLVNPGSVGQPRDRDPRAAFLIYDDRGEVEFRRVAYPIETAMKKIIESGLDRFLAERLSLGY
ncbi:MAG TPA: metallophosphoesterase family protein [Thermodesulfobacteriota bacterium]|nr:metallophosphoesterase family protein [Thermodesulfobacteriota bacterium]